MAKSLSRRSDRAAAAKAGPRECYHCKQWIADFSTHDCWTTTPEALTRDLPEDLRDAWERLRDTVLALGELRMYASHSSIMFSRKTCFCFVRPKPKRLELVIFLGRAVAAPQVRKAVASSRVKTAHEIHIVHRDQVEAPITYWMEEAYRTSDALSGRKPAGPQSRTRPTRKTSQRPKPKAKSPKPARRQAPGAKRRSNSQPASAKSRRRPARRAARGGR